MLDEAKHSSVVSLAVLLTWLARDFLVEDELRCYDSTVQQEASGYA